MSNNLDTDQARPFVGPDLGPKCLQKLSADDTSKQRLKVGVVFGKINQRENLQEVGYKSDEIVSTNNTKLVHHNCKWPLKPTKIYMYMYRE